MGKILNEKFLQYYTPKFQAELKKLEPGLLRDEVEPRVLQRFTTVYGKVIDYYHKITNRYKKKHGDFEYGWERPEWYYKLEEYEMRRNPKEFITKIDKYLGKKEVACRGLLEQYRQIAVDITPVSDVIKKLNALQKERKEQKKFPVSSKAAEKISALLEQHQDIVSLKKELTKGYTKELKASIKYFLENYEKMNGEVFEYKMSLGNLVEEFGAYDNRKYRKPRGYTKLLKSSIKTAVDRVVAQFTRKQILKIGPILDKSKQTPVLEAQTFMRESTPEGWVTVTYSDRSFKTKTQIVWCLSELLNEFARYPTTYHEITVKGVVVAKKESYEWMAENFHNL